MQTLSPFVSPCCFLSWNTQTPTSFAYLSPLNLEGSGYIGGLHNKPSALGITVLSSQINSKLFKGRGHSGLNKKKTTYFQEPAQQIPSHDSHYLGLSLCSLILSYAIRERGSMPMGTWSCILHFCSACLSSYPASPGHMILDHPCYKSSLPRGCSLHICRLVTMI